MDHKNLLRDRHMVSVDRGTISAGDSIALKTKKWLKNGAFNQTWTVLPTLMKFL